jgi:diguanylate cyclase (GGDEF)-like protein
MIETVLSLTTTPQGLDLFFFRPNAAPHETPLYVRGSRLREGPLDMKPVAALGAGMHWSRELRAGNDGWMTLVAVPMQGGPLAPRHERAWIVLIAGLIISFIAVAYLCALGRHALRLVRANKRVSKLAQMDVLTGLANRRAFVGRLTRAFAEIGRGSRPFCVLYFDLDHFKDVNDTLGHPIGDELLRRVTERVTKVVRATDLVARLGGDEFAVLLSNVSDLAAVGALAAKINNVLAAPYAIGGNEVRVTASIGISLYSPNMAGPQVMMIQADLALYRAKEDGRNCFRFHSQQLDEQVRERVTVAKELQMAIERDELELYYQPQVDLASGRLIGVEALLRWNHPKRGLLTPGTFISIAERTGAIIPLGEWALEKACQQLRAWQDQDIAPDVVAVNFSAIQFKGTSNLEHKIAETLEKWQIAPSNFEVELTESVLMELSEQHSETLQRLRQQGVKIAIDDFGTGYSSLTYLTTYPVSRLKIAQELVFRVTDDVRNATVVKAAIRLAHELGIEVIAEGVETESQARFLLSAGCALAQGYYFSRPVNAARTTELLRQGKIKRAKSFSVVEAKAA